MLIRRGFQGKEKVLVEGYTQSLLHANMEF